MTTAYQYAHVPQPAYWPAGGLPGGASWRPGTGGTVYDARKDVIWAPDAVVATALDGQDGRYDGKFFGTKIRVMKKKKGVPQYPGRPADYGYPDYANPKDPYVLAGAQPGQAVYDMTKNEILAPDAVTATALDLQDGNNDGTYYGAKVKVKKSKAPGYNPFYPLAKRQPGVPGYRIPGTYPQPYAPSGWPTPSPSRFPQPMGSDPGSYYAGSAPYGLAPYPVHTYARYGLVSPGYGYAYGYGYSPASAYGPYSYTRPLASAATYTRPAASYGDHAAYPIGRRYSLP